MVDVLYKACLFCLVTGYWVLGIECIGLLVTPWWHDFFEIVHNNINIPVRQSWPVHPCTHVQLWGAVHSLFTPQPPVQIAKGHNTVIVYQPVGFAMILLYSYRFHSCDCIYDNATRGNLFFTTKSLSIPVRQSCPVHPCTHVHLWGAVHFLFTPQPPVHIATSDIIIINLPCQYSSIGMKAGIPSWLKNHRSRGLCKLQ